MSAEVVLSSGVLAASVVLEILLFSSSVKTMAIALIVAEEGLEQCRGGEAYLYIPPVHFAAFRQ